MTQEKLNRFIQCIDVLVCPSRDDPMPIVVTQAMMHEKVCVMSENVGQAEFIKQAVNGFVFPNEDSKTLMVILVWMLENKNRHSMIGKASREIYKSEFSENIMEQRLSLIINELLRQGK